MSDQHNRVIAPPSLFHEPFLSSFHPFVSWVIQSTARPHYLILLSRHVVLISGPFSPSSPPHQHHHTKLPFCLFACLLARQTGMLVRTLSRIGGLRGQSLAKRFAATHQAMFEGECRIAVVGSGPAGMYTAETLCKVLSSSYFFPLVAVAAF